MGEEKFDVIIVGAGMAGNVAAYLLAQAGLEVLVIERGETSGSKNVTGGRMYSHALEKIIPNFAEEAPVERKIVKEKISMINGDGSFTTVEYDAQKLGEQGKASYSMLRAKFDPWLAGKAEEAGAMYVTGIRVDELIKKDGKVCGVKAGEEEMLADVVLLADGVNSLLAQQLGMKKELDPRETAVGVKEVIELGEDRIRDRFGVAGNDGAAWLFMGDVTSGNVGGGFLYTNKESVSIGIVTTIGDIGRNDLAPRDMLERLKAYPAVAPLIADGKTIEYAAHLVTEGGYKMVPTLYDNGVLLAGDAAAFVMNLGFTIRGMDLAAESGKLAAETIIKAKEAGDFSASTLSAYKTALENSFIMRDMKFYSKMPEFIDNYRLFEQYPGMMDTMMSGLFAVDGTAPVKFKKTAMAAAKKVGLLNIFSDVRKGMGAI